MLELHGVVAYNPDFFSTIKQRALLFDKFHLAGKPGILESAPVPEYLRAEGLFLQSAGIVAEIPRPIMMESLDNSLLSDDYLKIARFTAEKRREHGIKDGRLAADFHVRFLAGRLATNLAGDTAPICTADLPSSLFGIETPESPKCQVLRIAMEALPAPGHDASWQDIIAFKDEVHDKRWGFRRFLQTLATKRQTEAEVRDEIEWLLNEYRKAMEIHRIKASNSFVDVFLIAPLEILEDLVTFKWSKLAKGMLSSKKDRSSFWRQK
jgi:hypothetical protein